VPIEYNFKQRNEYVVCLELDPSWQITYLPKNTEYQKDFLFYQVNYQQQKNLLVRKETLQESTLMLYPSDFGTYNALVEAIQKSYTEQIIIKQ
jgi:hypothetical protein